MPSTPTPPAEPGRGDPASSVTCARSRSPSARLLTQEREVAIEAEVGPGRVDRKTLQFQHDRKVRGFLEFKRKDTGPYRMSSPGGDKDSVARLDR